MQADPGEDTEGVADTLELLQAFRQIRNPGVRRTVISIAHAMRPDAPSRHDFYPFVEEETVAPPHRTRPAVSLGSGLLFVCSLIGAAFLLEIVDPAPMNVAASAICRTFARPAAVSQP